MTQKEVEIYTTQVCPYCKKAKALLDKKGVKYEEISVDEEAARQEMIDRTGGARSVPQIFIGGELIEGGADGLLARDRQGELDNLLGIN